MLLPAVETPNERRGGWSWVWHLSLTDQGGSVHHYFMKRQHNHLSRQGILQFDRPTFYREYKNILTCKARRLPCLDVHYYNEQKHIS